jgi:hypothetical protein
MACRRFGRHHLKLTRLAARTEKKLSIAALSQTLPGRLIEQMTPLSVIRVWNR